MKASDDNVTAYSGASIANGVYPWAFLKDVSDPHPESTNVAFEVQLCKRTEDGTEVVGSATYFDHTEALHLCQFWTTGGHAMVLAALELVKPKQPDPDPAKAAIREAAQCTIPDVGGDTWVDAVTELGYAAFLESVKTDEPEDIDFHSTPEQLQATDEERTEAAAQFGRQFVEDINDWLFRYEL